MANEKIPSQVPRSNVPELSVSELSLSLKRTLEETYGRVRVRGELSRVTIPRSGHMYADIKDENAVMNTVCWKGTVAKLPLKPEEGLEVICTGRVSTYPARSNYQLIIESMELAGEGALLKMLEERKKKLAAEGLFDEARKKKLPFLPQRIGVVTSATGAVIRDIMHRLNDRFPRHVLVWPVLVQGDGAAEQVAQAIYGFNALDESLRPDLLIVARGGGSLEDLMPFNEEVVVRAAADSTIPLISAVGHETDTTLIDYAADVRAPTPTGAAEMAVPRRLDLMSQVAEDQQRLIGAMGRLLSYRSERLENISARLGDPARLLETKMQRLDNHADKLLNCFERGITARRQHITEIAARLADPGRLIEIKQQKLENLGHKISSCYERTLSSKRSRAMEAAARLRTPKSLIAEKKRTLASHNDRLLGLHGKLLVHKEKELQAAGRMLESLSFKSILNRGFVVVRDASGHAVTAAANTRSGQHVCLQFKDGETDATIGTGTPETGPDQAASPPQKPAKTQRSPPKSDKNKDQGQLF